MGTSDIPPLPGIKILAPSTRRRSAGQRQRGEKRYLWREIKTAVLRVWQVAPKGAVCIPGDL